MMPHSVPPPVMMYPVTGYTPKDVDVNLTYSNGNFNLNGVIEKRRLYIHQSGNIPAHMDRVTSYTPLNQINLIYNNGQSIGLDEALTSRHLYISSYCMQCSGKKCVRCETGGKSRRRHPRSRHHLRSRRSRSRHCLSSKRRRRRN